MTNRIEGVVNEMHSEQRAVCEIPVAEYECVRVTGDQSCVDNEVAGVMRNMTGAGDMEGCMHGCMQECTQGCYKDAHTDTWIVCNEPYSMYNCPSHTTSPSPITNISNDEKSSYFSSNTSYCNNFNPTPTNNFESTDPSQQSFSNSEIENQSNLILNFSESENQTQQNTTNLEVDSDLSQMTCNLEPENNFHQVINNLDSAFQPQSTSHYLDLGKVRKPNISKLKANNQSQICFNNLDPQISFPQTFNNFESENTYQERTTNFRHRSDQINNNNFERVDHSRKVITNLEEEDNFNNKKVNLKSKNKTNTTIKHIKNDPSKNIFRNAVMIDYSQIKLNCPGYSPSITHSNI